MTETTRLIAGPFNRVEGDLEIRLDIAGGRVTRAEANSPLFRGFEPMLEGKAPQDALTITPRICGICSISQSMAAALALAEACGAAPAPMGARAAALIHGAENLADHITHFHLFFMPDFARPAYEGRGFHPRAHARFGPGGGALQPGDQPACAEPGQDRRGAGPEIGAGGGGGETARGGAEGGQVLRVTGESQAWYSRCLAGPRPGRRGWGRSDRRCVGSRARRGAPAAEGEPLS